MSKVHQKEGIKRSNSSVKSSGGTASNKIMRSQTMQEKSDKQSDLFGDAANEPKNIKIEEKYVKTSKKKAYIRAGVSEKSQKINTSKLKKGSIFLVGKDVTTMNTSGLFRTKKKDYFKIKAPVEYKNLWLKESHTEATKEPKNKNIDDLSIKIEEEIKSGAITTRETLFEQFEKNNIALDKQVKIMKVYELHRKTVTDQVEIIINNIDKYETVEEAELALKSVKHSEYDILKVRKEFVENKERKYPKMEILSGGVGTILAGKSLLGLKKGLTSTQSSLTMAIQAKEDAGTVFSEAGKQMKNIGKDLTSKLSFASIGNFMKKIKKFLASPAIPFLSIVGGGIVSLGLSIKETWDSHKLLNKFKNAKSESIEMIRDAVDYGFKKIRRAFWSKVRKLFSSVIGFASKLAAILSGGLLAGVALAVSTFNTVIGSLETLYKKTKGFYKFLIGSRGKNRAKYAGEIVNSALDTNDELSQKFMIEVMPKVDISSWWKVVGGSESTKIVISRYKDLDNKEQDIYKNALIENLAKAMKSQ